MKTTFVLMSMVFGFCVCGCCTAHKVEHGTVHAAKVTGHAVGNATEKVGDSIAHGGEKLEDKSGQ
jgi:hypothetical protein